MNPTHDRRRYPRHVDLGSDAHVTLSGTDEALPLLDLSWGGMCLHSPKPLEIDGTYCVSIDLPDLPIATATVEARIRHVQNSSPGRFRIGAEFLSSNQPWLGPEE